MPHLSRLIVVACLTALVATPPLFAQEMEDVVYLNDGSIVRGTVIERIPGELLKIQTQDGTVFVYTMDEITRMTKEPVMELGGRMGARQKQPLLAFGLSLLIPGASLGQMVCKQLRRRSSSFARWVIRFRSTSRRRRQP